MNTIYASFPSVETAERAAGALIDHGVRPEDVSFVANRTFPDGEQAVVDSSDGRTVYMDANDVDEIKEVNEAESAAKHGISTTTAADVSAGAVKGVAWGAGAGVLAAIASLFVPGVGWVLGGGTLATAVIGAAATTAAGAAAGGVYGYLRDQGLPEELIVSYTTTLTEGGAILAVNAPSGEVDQATIQALLGKYEATNVNHFGTMPYQEAG